MGYDRGDSFLFDYEPNGIPFGSKPKRILSPRSHPIQFERKWKYSFLSVAYVNGAFNVVFLLQVDTRLEQSNMLVDSVE